MDAGITNFEMQTIEAFRVNDRYQLVPNIIQEKALISAPSVARGAQSGLHTNAVAWNTTEESFVLYLPESRAMDSSKSDEVTCLVVGGKYNEEENVTYYRIDFQDESGTQLGEILRNHHYTFNVESVSQTGKTTAEEAAESTSSGITASIVDWQQNRNSIIFNGEHYFGVSSREVSLRFRSGSIKYIDIITNITDYTLQPSDADGNPIASTQPGDEATGTVYTASISDDKKQIKVTSVSENQDVGNRNDYFIILAGEWKILITVSQESRSKYSQIPVRMLSISTSIGYWGGNLFSNRTLTGDGRGLRNLLESTDNFSPTGIIPVSYIGLDYITGTPDPEEFTNYLELFDVVNIPYSVNLSDNLYRIILNWLNKQDNRFLFVSHDNTTTNSNLLQLLGLGDNSMWHSPSSTQNYVIAELTEDNRYFLRDGPFGSVSENMPFNRFDGIWLGLDANIAASSGITPILRHTDTDNCVVLGIDLQRRIAYVSESQFYQNNANGLYNADMSREPNKLFGNIFAWIIEEVIMPGKVETK